MKRYFLLIICVLGSSIGLLAQSGIIKGRVADPINNEPVMFANVLIEGTDKGTTTDLDGNYKFENLEPGIYNLQVSYVG